MAEAVYEVVPHDGGWAYKYQGVFSETYPTHDEAAAAARAAAQEQEIPGPPEVIEYQDEEGKWHEEVAPGDDRPSTAVVD